MSDNVVSEAEKVLRMVEEPAGAVEPDEVLPPVGKGRVPGAEAYDPETREHVDALVGQCNALVVAGGVQPYRGHFADLYQANEDALRAELLEQQRLSEQLLKVTRTLTALKRRDLQAQLDNLKRELARDEHASATAGG